MEYLEAYKLPFRRPDWFKNLLLLCVCQLIPVVGPIVVLGYFREVFLALRQDRRALYPPFVFGNFGPYLMEGIWPFLVGLASMLVLMPLTALSYVPLLAIPIFHLRGLAVALPILLTAALFVLIGVLSSFVLIPIYVRAILMQEFVPAFNYAFVWDYIRRVWRQQILVHLFLAVTGIPLMLLGMLCCYIGMFPAMTILTFASWYLIFQLYWLYLERGGADIPVKTLPETSPVPAYAPPPPPPPPPGQ